MKLITEKRYLLTPADHQSHLEISFTLDRPYSKMHLHFSYSPKWVEEERAVILIQNHLKQVIPNEQMERWGDPTRYLPLENLMTLSLDYDQQYIGAHHCKETTQNITISEQGSTKGFVKQPVEQGKWCIKVSTHCLQSEAVRLYLTVSVE